MFLKGIARFFRLKLAAGLSPWPPQRKEVCNLCDTHTLLFYSKLIMEEADIPREGLGLWGRTHEAFYFGFYGRPSSCDEKNKSNCPRKNIILEQTRNCLSGPIKKKKKMEIILQMSQLKMTAVKTGLLLSLLKCYFKNTFCLP